MANHATELREQVSHVSYCVEPGCEYYGERSVQGRCFQALDDEIDRYITKLHERAEQGLSEIKQIAGDKYLEHLEFYYIFNRVNNEFTLDELVKLRLENRRLRDQARLPHE